MSIESKRFTATFQDTGHSKVDYLPVETLNNEWEFIHRPFDWTVAGGKFLPVLTQIFFYKGLNNFVGDHETVRAIYRGKGCTCIPYGDQRLGPFAQYRGTVPATNPEFRSAGVYHISAWESPENIAGETIWSFDQAGYDEFLEHLVDAGIVRIDSTIATICIRRKKHALENLKRIERPRESTKTQIKLMEADLKAMEKIIPTLKAPVAAIQKRGSKVPKTNPEPELKGS